jgi:hypothetical protein
MGLFGHSRVAGFAIVLFVSCSVFSRQFAALQILVHLVQASLTMGLIRCEEENPGERVLSHTVDN